MREGIGEKALIHSGGGLFEGELVGNTNQAWGGNDGVSGVGTSHEDDAVAGMEMGDVGGDGFDDASALTTERGGEFVFVGRSHGASIESVADELAAAFLDVEEIYACGLDADEYLAGTGFWRRQIFETDYFGAAVGFNTDRTYGWMHSYFVANRLCKLSRI